MSLVYLSAGKEFLEWLRLQAYRPRLCMYVRCTGIVVVNTDRQTVCTYVRLIIGDINFEAYTESHGVDIKHYHSENRNLRSELCINHCKYMHQRLTFYVVNAHNRNG